MGLTRWLSWRRRRDDDLQEEIASHLAMAARDRVAGGEDEASARLAARKEFGNVPLTREATRAEWRGLWMDRVAEWARDARYAFRLLLRSPAYSLVVIVVLALGVGTNLVAFGLFRAIALSPLSGVPDSARLQFVLARTTGDAQTALPYPDYRYLRDHMESYEELAGSYVQGWMLGRGTGARIVYGELVSGNFFDVLGVGAQLGRTLRSSDDVRGGPPVVVLSDGVWRRDFGADPEVIGKTIDLARARLTIVGVADAAFHGSAAGLDTALFVPYAMQPELDGFDGLDSPEASWVFAFGHPRPGVSLARARAEAAALSADLERDRPVEGLARRAVVIPIWQSPQGAQTYMLPAVSLMGVMSLLLLLVVCANVAGLVLVRGIGRRAEIGVRLALGASRARVMRLLLVENLLLAVPGALAGFWLTRAVAPYLLAAQPSVAVIPPLFFNVDRAPYASGAALLACLGMLAAGLVPALRASRLDLASAMKDDLAPSGAGRNRLRSGLVVAQVTMALLLLVGTALVTRSLGSARQANPGFDAGNVAFMWLFPEYSGTGLSVFYQTLLGELRDDPAIESATVMKNPLLVLFDMNIAEFRPEHDERPRGDDVRFGLNVVGTDYFRVMRIPLVAGREFDGRDAPSAEPVAVVNETLARRFWGSPSAAIGQRLRTEAWSLGSMTVVGVARDGKYARLTEPPRPYVYLPHAQASNGIMFVLARGPTGAAALDALGRHVRDLDPALPVMQEGMLADQTNLGLGIYDVTARVMGVVGLAAIGLMGIGIYGLVAYTVRQSTHDTGIRMAIGASRNRIVGRFLMRGLWLGMAGAALGVAAALALTRLMASVLYGVDATDMVSFVVASVAVLATTLAASFVPAWRASRVDPLVVLRRS